MREDDQVFSSFVEGLSSKDKRISEITIMEVFLDIRKLLVDCRQMLFEMNYVDDDGTCYCPDCMKERDEVETEEIVEVFHPTDDEVEELYRKENGDDSNS